MRNGEAAAFEKLMRRYNQRVFRAARAVLRNDSEAKDVVQEAFVRAYYHLRDFEERSSFATWLTRIAVNEALSRVRRSQLFRPLENDADQEGGYFSAESHQPGPEKQTGYGELRSVLMTAIDALSEDLRTVFVLREIEGLSTLETGEILRLSSEAVRARLHRARQALRRQVEQRVGRELRGLFKFAGRRCDQTVEQVFRRLGLQLRSGV